MITISALNFQQVQAAATSLREQGWVETGRTEGAGAFYIDMEMPTTTKTMTPEQWEQFDLRR